MIANSPEKSANYLVGGVDAAAETTHLRRPQRIEARWRSGDVEDCKSSHPGSIPGRASSFKSFRCYMTRRTAAIERSDLMRGPRFARHERGLETSPRDDGALDRGP